MADIDISMGDNNRTITLADNYGYLKTVVPFSDIKGLLECDHLGGRDIPGEKVA
ncbi:hypothetical protein D3C86_1802150 [compost metagenome]